MTGYCSQWSTSYTTMDCSSLSNGLCTMDTDYGTCYPNPNCNSRGDESYCNLASAGGCSWVSALDCSSINTEGACNAQSPCSWSTSAGNNYIDAGVIDFSGLNAYSVSGWVNPTDLSGTYLPLFAQRTSCGSLNMQVYAKDSGDCGGNYPMAYQTTSVESKLLCGTQTLSTGTWYMLTSTYNGTDFTLYINGAYDTSSSTSGTLQQNSVNSYIGWDSCGSNYLSGAVDDFRLYNYSLTPTQVSDLYNSGSGTEEPINYTSGTTTTENDTLLLNYTVVARSFNVQTEVFKSNKTALSFVKNASELLYPNGKPNDKAFSYSYEKLDNWIITGYNTTTIKECKLGIFNCKTKTITTPIIENRPLDSVNLVKEIALQKQQIYELTTALCKFGKDKVDGCTADGKVLK